jgi:hypothetical protein
MSAPYRKSDLRLPSRPVLSGSGSGASAAGQSYTGATYTRLPLKMPSKPTFGESGAAKPAAERKCCIVCMQVDDVKNMVLTNCCKVWMHKYKHPMLLGGCSWELCPNVVDRKTASAVAKVLPPSGEGVKSADAKTAAAVNFKGADVGTTAAGGATQAAAAKPLASQPPAAGASETAEAAKAAVAAAAPAPKPLTEAQKAAYKKETIEDLTTWICRVVRGPASERLKDFPLLLSLYGMDETYHKEKLLLCILKDIKLSKEEISNLKETFHQFDIDFSKIENARVGYNEIFEFLYPDELALHYVHVKNSVAAAARPAPTESLIALKTEQVRVVIADTHAIILSLFRQYGEDKLTFEALSNAIIEVWKRMPHFKDNARLQFGCFELVPDYIFTKFEKEGLACGDEAPSGLVYRAFKHRTDATSLNIEKSIKDLIKDPSDANLKNLIDCCARKVGRFDLTQFLTDKLNENLKELDEAKVAAFLKVLDVTPFTDMQKEWHAAIKAVVAAKNDELVKEREAAAAARQRRFQYA